MSKASSRIQSGNSLIKCLTECDKGSELNVLKINAGSKAKTRLADLGVIPGSKIYKTKEAPFHGPLEIKVKGSQLVLGRGIAEKILVQCENGCSL